MLFAAFLLLVIFLVFCSVFGICARIALLFTVYFIVKFIVKLLYDMGTMYPVRVGIRRCRLGCTSTPDAMDSVLTFIRLLSATLTAAYVCVGGLTKLLR